MIDWHDLTPAEVLDAFPVMELELVAYVIREYHTAAGARQGKPNVARVRQLITAGSMYPMDPEQPARHWKVSANEVRRYMDRVDLKAAS